MFAFMKICSNEKGPSIGLHRTIQFYFKTSIDYIKLYFQWSMLATYLPIVLDFLNLGHLKYLEWGSNTSKH